MVNIRTKGQRGERDVASQLNDVFKDVCNFKGIEYCDKDLAQRNQNQTAVGGCDLINTFGFAIEVKNQATLSLGCWWRQACEQAVELGKEPVLIYKHKRKWRVVLNLTYRGYNRMNVQSDISLNDFLNIYRAELSEILR